MKDKSIHNLITNVSCYKYILLQAQISVDQNVDNIEDPGNDNDNEDNTVATRNLTQDTVIHCDSINYDVLCALAGTTNLGGVRNFTMRVRWRNYSKIET